MARGITRTIADEIKEAQKKGKGHALDPLKDWILSTGGVVTMALFVTTWIIIWRVSKD